MHFSSNDFLNDFVNQIQISAFFGKNNFSMSRGSFLYRRKLWGKKNFLLVQKADSEHNAVFKTADGNRITLSVEEQNYSFGTIYRIKTSYEGEKKYNRFSIKIPAYEDECIYGCGETYSRFNLKGEKVRIWVAEHQNAKRITSKLIKQKIFGIHPEKTLPFNQYESYYAQPTFTSSRKYFIHADSNCFAEFDFTKSDSITLHFEELPEIFAGYADDFTKLSWLQTELLGRQKEIPDWCYDGAIVAVQEGCAAVDTRIQKALDAGARISGVWSQDWCGCRRTGFGYQVMWNCKWDNTLYPNLPEKIKEWNAKGITFLGYINPFLALEKELYQIASENGYCVKDKNGKDYLVTITTFPAAMIDLTNPDAYSWYKSIIRKNMIEIGMSGWMADFGEYLPTDCVLYNKKNPEELHNQWPAIWAKMNAEVIKECGKEGEIFFFTRAGYTGTVSSSTMMWTGDQHVDWSVDDGIGSVIPATLSLAMSGFGITHSDTGGYTTILQMTRSKELLLRWEEMNVFSPLYRFHEGNQPKRNVQFDSDKELLTQLSKCSRMHELLKPYIKNAVKETAQKGTPVMRPVFYHYDEKEAYTEKTEYLLGRDILVAPVIRENQTKREVYLPDEKWIHIFSGKEFSGGHFDVESPIGEPPVFIRKESIYCQKIIDDLRSVR